MAGHEFPFRRADRILFRIYALFGLKRKFRSFGRGAFLSPYTRVQGAEHVSLDPRVHISAHCRIIALEAHEDRAPEITFGEGTYVGESCVVAAAGRMTIGRDVTFGDNVHLTCAQHQYRKIGTGVLDQGLIPADIEIGDRAWLGYGAFISAKGALSIGEHAVVSANSVVTKDVPAFTVVAGNPAVPILRYDPATDSWVRVPREASMRG